MNSGIKRDTAFVEQEALKLFLESVKNEINERFSLFHASVDRSDRLPSIVIKEK